MLILCSFLNVAFELVAISSPCSPESGIGWIPVCRYRVSFQLFYRSIPWFRLPLFLFPLCWCLYGAFRVKLDDLIHLFSPSQR